MAQNSLSICGGIVALLTLPLAPFLAQNVAPRLAATTNTAPWIGRTAPDFPLQIENGETKSLTSYRGSWGGAEETQAAELTARGQHKEAEPILKKLAESDPGNARVLGALTTNVAWLKGYGPANAFLGDALKKWPAKEPAPGFLRLQQIGSEKETNDAMLWAPLVPLAQGQRPAALLHARAFQKNIPRANWAFTFLWSIDRWLAAPPAE